MADKLTKVELDQCAQALGACACVNLRKSSRAVTRLFDEELEACGLRSTQLTILLTIAALERPTQTRIARELVAEQSTISRNLKILSGEGLIKTTAVRGTPYRTISLTPKGIKRIREAIPIWTRTQQAFVEKFGQKQWAASLDSLSKAVSSVHAIERSTD